MTRTLRQYLAGVFFRAAYVLDCDFVESIAEELTWEAQMRREAQDPLIIAARLAARQEVERRMMH